MDHPSLYYLYGGREGGSKLVVEHARHAPTCGIPPSEELVGPLFSTLFGGKISYMEFPRDRQHSLN